MTRTHYSDYVQHCLRFYARYENPKFRSEAEKHDWSACERAFEGFSEKDREGLLYIYREKDTFPDNIYQWSKSSGVPQETIWKLVDKLEREVAKQRGLM